MVDSKEDRLREVGKNALASIRCMVEALQCDYDRLQELRDEFEEWRDLAVENSDPENGGQDRIDKKTLTLADWANVSDDAEELKELEEAAAGGEIDDPCESEDDARERINEDALSLQVRGGWHNVGDTDVEDEEFELLLTTGGPAVRIIGELQGGEPHRCWLEVQDWGTPWTEYYESDMAAVCLAYARVFFG